MPFLIYFLVLLLGGWLALNSGNGKGAEGAARSLIATGLFGAIWTAAFIVYMVSNYDLVRK